jgi:hypothetical protein
MLRRLFPVLGFWAALTVAAGALADTPAPWPVPTSGTVCYRTTLVGAVFSYSSVTYALIRDQQGAECLQVTTRRVLFGTGDKRPVVPVIVIEVDVYARDLSQLSWKQGVEGEDPEAGTSAYRAGPVVHLPTSEGTDLKDQTLTVPGDYKSDLSLYADVVSGALQPGDTCTRSDLFPIGGGDFHTKTTTIGPPETIQIMGQAQRCWPLKTVDSRLRTESHVWLNAQGLPVRQTLPSVRADTEEVSQADALQALTDASKPH